MGRFVIPAQRGGVYRPDKPKTRHWVTRRVTALLPACGFTAVELLITLAAIAMLVTIAYPTYIGYKVRANRAAAQSFLIDLANREQLYFLDARAYANNLAQLGAAAIPAEVSSYYLIPDPVVNNSAAPPTFTVSAMAKAGTMQANDGDLSINSVGMRSGHW